MQNSHKYQHFALDINNNIVNIKNIMNVRMFPN